MDVQDVKTKLEVLKSQIEELVKWERHGSTTMVNREAHYQALAAVKDHVLKYVAKLVEDMAQEEVKHVFVAGCEVTIRKLMPDMYSGHVRKGTSIIHQFDRITIPQLAGQLQSLLELYDPSKVEDASQPPNAMILDKLKPLAEQAENGMVSQLLAILGNPVAKPVEAKPVDPRVEINQIIAEANAITEEANRRRQTVDPKAELQDLKERVEAMLHRVESLVSAKAPTSKDEDKLHDTLHQMQRKHDTLTDRAEQELNVLNDKIKALTEKLDGRDTAGKTITITVK